jgi:MFS family permease
MFNKYRQVFAGNSAWRFSTAGFIARMPISMVGIGVLMFVQAERGSYTIAGALSATIAISGAIGGPISSRLVDRLGQHRVLPFQISITVASAIALIFLIPSDTPVGYLFIFAISSGLASPTIGALVRARWTSLLKSGPILLTAFSIESIIDEMIFILGPTVAATTSVKIHPAAPQIIAAVLLLIGGTWLASMRDSEPELHPRQNEHRRPVIFANGLPYVWVIHLAAGGFFGAIELSIIAVTEQADRPIYGGIFLALWSVGSLIGGLIYGGSDIKTPLATQLILISAILIPASVALIFVESFTILAILSVVAGFGIAPLLIVSMGITQQRSPVGRTTEAISTMYAGLGLGFAAATAVTGWLIDNRGTNYAFGVGALTAIVTLLVSLAARKRLSSVLT